MDKRIINWSILKKDVFRATEQHSRRRKKFLICVLSSRFLNGTPRREVREIYVTRMKHARWVVFFRRGSALVSLTRNRASSFVIEIVEIIDGKRTNALTSSSPRRRRRTRRTRRAMEEEENKINNNNRNELPAKRTAWASTRRFDWWTGGRILRTTKRASWRR